jgi:hypothetical protein
MSALPNSLQIRTESLHDPNDEIVQLYQYWDKRLRLPITGIPERYRGNELGIGLHLRLPFGLGDYSFHVTHDASLQHIGWNCNPTASNTQDELPMFIRNVHVVKDEEGVFERLGGVVRLQPLNGGQNVRVPNSLYFSFILGKTVFLPWPRLEDWKLDEFPVLSRSVFLTRKRPYDMIKAGPQVMDDLACEDTETERNFLLLKVLVCVQEKLHILLWENWIAAFLEKSVNLDLKVLDVCAGPF